MSLVERSSVCSEARNFSAVLLQSDGEHFKPLRRALASRSEFRSAQNLYFEKPERTVLIKAARGTFSEPPESVRRTLS